MRLATLLRAAGRESRGARGRLWFFTACLALGSMAVVGVSGFARAVRAALAVQSRELLGADLYLESDEPLPEVVATRLSERLPPGTRLAPVRLVQTMARAVGREGSRLVELKAVGPGFPFHGTLALEPGGTLDELIGPERVVVAAELAAALHLEPGDGLRLGSAAFEIAALVRDEPGRLDPTFTAGPRVFASLEGFERMQLEGPGSRITYQILVGLPAGVGAGADWQHEATEALAGTHVEGLRVGSQDQPQVRRAADRVEHFLGLVALLSLVLGGIGVAEIVRAWIGSRVGSIGVLRALGFTPRGVLAIYAGHVLLLALVGSAAGALLGSLLPLALPSLVPELLPSGLELAWQPLSILRGVGLGALVALAFGLPALAGVWRVSPLRVLRHEAEPLPPARAVQAGAYALLVASLFLAARVQSGRSEHALYFTAGALVVLALFALGARLLTGLARRVPRARLAPGLVHALAALARPGAGVLGALASLGLGTLVTVTLLLAETRLSARLAGALPVGGPSLFFLNLQPDQRADFERTLSAHGADSVRIVPMATARLSAVDDARDEHEPEDSGRRARDRLGREQRLTWQSALTSDNRVVAGTLWGDPEHAEVSLEERYAERIGVRLGSRLTFDLSGVPIELVVTSLREVDWESFGINFFIVAEPGVLDDAPHTLLAAARLDPAEEAVVQDELLDAIPNLVVVDVRAILEKVRRVLTRAAGAVELLGSLTALVGLVLLAGVAGLGALRRTREAALWKVLGVTRGGVARLFALEFALLGLVAGLLGAGGACALVWAFFEHVLELGSDVPWWTVPAAGACAAGLCAACGLTACLPALRARPIESLRG